MIEMNLSEKTQNTPQTDKKRMLDWSEENGKMKISLNFSSLDLIQTCKRKAFYALEMRLKSKFPQEALIFGKAVHSAMEVWYCTSRDQRQRSSGACDDTQAQMLQGGEFKSHGSCPRCSAVFAFLQTGQELGDLDASDKRSLANGVDILNNYFDERIKDPYQVLTDSKGPLIERSCEIKLFSSDTLDVYFHGTIDMIVVDSLTSQIIICDHKTTSALGKEFFNKIKPNFQNTGYYLLAKEVLDVKADLFMINGIQVAKLKRDSNKQFVKIDGWEIEEFFLAIHRACLEYQECLKSAQWPMTAPGPCSNYGGCLYHDLCDIPPSLRENVMKMSYIKEEK